MKNTTLSTYWSLSSSLFSFQRLCYHLALKQNMFSAFCATLDASFLSSSELLTFSFSFLLQLLLPQGKLRSIYINTVGNITVLDGGHSLASATFRPAVNLWLYTGV